MNIPIACQHEWQVHDEPIKDDHFEVCLFCGVIRTTVKHNINECLGSDYGRTYFEKKDMCSIVNGIPMNKNYTDERMQYLLNIGLDKSFGNKNLLYIGPGIGQHIPHCLYWGWNIVCVEMGLWPATYIKHAYPPVEVHCVDFMAIEVTQFDAIIANHVLEHFKDADRAFEKMVETLAPGGKLYIEVPTADDIYIADHWWHFSKQSLEYWFNNMPLKDISILEHIGKDGRITSYNAIATKKEN